MIIPPVILAGCSQAIWRWWVWRFRKCINGWVGTSTASKTREALHIYTFGQGWESSNNILASFLYPFPLNFVYFQHFQRDIVRGVEGYVVTGSKQVEIGNFAIFIVSFHLKNLSSANLKIYLIGTKLSEDSKRYGVENSCTIGSTLSKAALQFGRTRAQIETERGNLLKALSTQV